MVMDNTDSWRGYDGLGYVRFDSYFRIRYEQDEFALGDLYINGIECLLKLRQSPAPAIQGCAQTYLFTPLEGVRVSI